MTASYNPLVSTARPVHRPTTFWIILALIIFGFIVFLPALVQLPFSQLLPARNAQRSGPNKDPNKRVWVSKRSGYYYCPGSQAYGTVTPGDYMTRMQANQEGYRPAPNIPCD
jgi:hypothetical protein